MSVIACLQLPSGRSVCDEAIWDICADLTPVVEPDDECVWMDWSGCGSVPKLADKLAAGLQSVGLYSAAVTGSKRADNSSAYRLGVAPVRFVAGVLALSESGIMGDDGSTQNMFREISATTIAGGYWVAEHILPALLTRLPLPLLPELMPNVQETLAALGVRTLGDLLRIPRGFLYSHIGRDTDKLLDWARGRDPRRVHPLYPPDRLRRRIPAEMLLPPYDAKQLEDAVARAATELAAELQASDRACAQLSVSIGKRRYQRLFTPPVTDSEQLVRISRHIATQLLIKSSTSGPSASKSSVPGEIGARSNKAFSTDGVIEVTPAAYAGKQTSLWTPDRLCGASRHPALAAIRARFGHVFRFGASRGSDASHEPGCSGVSDGSGGCYGHQGAIERYEAMCRFYG